MKTQQKFEDFQAEYEGSIPFTRSNFFNGLARIFRSHSDNHSDNQADHRSNFCLCYKSREPKFRRGAFNRFCTNDFYCSFAFVRERSSMAAIPAKGKAKSNLPTLMCSRNAC
jgi:hypothetical protein